MKKGFLLILALIGAGVLVPDAGAVSVQRTKRSLIRTSDANGQPIAIESDKGWKVFEVDRTQGEVQVTDEDNVAPVSGILHKVCVESAADATFTGHFVLVWDTSTETGGASTAGRRLLPALTRASGALRCSDVLDVQFANGLRAQQSSTHGSTYIYWRGLGDRR